MKVFENIVIKIDTGFNLNVLLKLFFSLSKKIIFFSPILANNNLPLKIYCKSIVKILWYHFLFFFFLFFPSFFILHTHTAFLFLLFPFFYSSTHVPLHFSFFTSFLFCNLPLPPNSRTFQLSFFLFFFFFFSFLPFLLALPFSLY